MLASFRIDTVFPAILLTLLIGFLVVRNSRMKRAEEDLRQSEGRFTLFMDNSPAVIFMKDEQGHYVYMNEAYQKRLNVRLEDRQGKTDFEIYPLAIAEEYRKNDHAAIVAGHSIVFSEETPGPEGEHFYWLVYKFPFQDASGRTFVAGIGVDITENRRLLSIEKELEIAHEIQLSILPSNAPELESLRINAAYLPMTAVAGDYYEFIPVDQNRVGFLVADVSGHGVPAALIASMIKVAMQSLQSFAQDPPEVLRRLNRILFGQMQSQLVSAAYLWLDTKNRQGLYSAAGHPPLLHWRENKLKHIVSNGLPIGVEPGSVYPVCEMPLNAGDRFLLYTDGVIEPENAAGEAFGDHELEQVVRKNHLLPPFEFSEQLLSALRNWQPASMIQHDDITLIIIDVV
jgi:PAS domain S-box-containing protein